MLVVGVVAAFVVWLVVPKFLSALLAPLTAALATIVIQ